MGKFARKKWILNINKNFAKLPETSTKIVKPSNNFISNAIKGF